MDCLDLKFPADQYTVKTTCVQVEGVDCAVTYRSYQHLPYVSRPVDVEYQSMDILVPETINGKAYDASQAPVFFMIGVGGYMSDNNVHKFAPPPPPPPEGGPDPDAVMRLTLPGLGGMAGADAYMELALAFGFVVVHPGCRGRDCRRPDGSFFGKAPAAIVDLKAAVRYLRQNQDVIPGNMERILCSGGSAGGALSCLLAASGNASAYLPYLEEIGAADQRDDVFASSSYSPILNLENSDAAYEWEFGSVPCGNRSFGPFKLVPGLVDQTVSGELKALFGSYQDSLALQGRMDYGPVTSENLKDYLVRAWLIPEAERCFATLPQEVLTPYLDQRPWISCQEGRVSFRFEDYAVYAQRGKGLPAFDDFELHMAEPNLFGSRTVDSRHFTAFSQAHDPHATGPVEEDVVTAVRLMNPMNFAANCPGCARHWWIRHGAVDNSTALPVVTNFADLLSNHGKDVNARLIWDGGHCDDDQPEAMLKWMKALS